MGNWLRSWRVVPLLLALMTALTVSGCGGGNILGQGDSGSGNGGGNENRFVGTYRSATVTHAQNVTGVLQLTTQSNLSASGTYTITDTTRIVFPANVTGTVDNDTGIFELNGTYTDNGTHTVRITGRLPATGQSGSIEVFIDGTSVGEAALNQTSGGGNNNGGGGASSLTFSNLSGSNVNSSTFNPQQGAVVVTQPAQQGLNGTIAGAVNTGGLSGVRTLSVNITLNQTFAAGDVLTVGNNNTQIVSVQYTDATLTGQQNNWIANGGTIEVVGIQGDRARLRLVNVTFAPAPAGGATGTFTMNGNLNGY